MVLLLTSDYLLLTANHLPLSNHFLLITAHYSRLAAHGSLPTTYYLLQAYLFPAELFATSIRGSALGVANVFARTGTVLVPLLATAPAHQVQLHLGSYHDT